MACYDPPPSKEEIERWRQQSAESWYNLTPAESIQEWLCDVLRGNPPHPECLRWWELHKKYHDKET